MKNLKKCLAGLALLACYWSMDGRPDTLFLNGPFARINLIPYAELYMDSTGELTIEDLLTKMPVFSSDFDLGYENTYPRAFWLRFRVTSETDLENARLLVNDFNPEDRLNYRNDLVDLYQVSEGTVIRHDQTGTMVPRNRRSIPGRAFVNLLPFSISKGQSLEFYLRIRNIVIPDRAWIGIELRAPGLGEPNLVVSGKWQLIGSWGMFLIVGIYVLVFYFYVKDPAYLYFGLFCFLFSLNYLTLDWDGIFFDLIAPNHPKLAIVNMFGHMFCLTFLFLFGWSFVNVRRHFPKWSWYYILVTCAVTFFVFFDFLKSFGPVYNLNFNATYVSFLLAVPFLIRFLLSKQPYARLFAAGIFLFLIGNVVGILGEVNGTSWTIKPWFVGQVGLLSLFAMGLGIKFLDGQRQRINADKVRELDQMKNRFFANISHEFRTPLSLIMGPLQHARESLPASEVQDTEAEVPVQAKHLEMMTRNARRLQQLIDQLLDLSKLESGKMELRLEKGDIIRFIRTRVAAFESLADRKKIHLITSFPEDRPDAWFDPDKVEKILVNLVSNALKFTPENGNVRVEVTDKDDRIQVRVSDNGPGIPNADIDRIFDRFYQIENNGQPGTGIGLALTRELVELHKGRVSVESRQGKGAAFTFIISVNPDDFPPEALVKGVAASGVNGAINLPADIQPYAPDQPGKTGEGPLVLVVEDNPDLRTFVREILEREYQVLTANNGREGWKLAQSYLPDIVISDVMMPDPDAGALDGVQLCHKLKREEKTCHIPVILLTARAGREDKVEGLQTGADDYLTKPFDALELKARIANQIEIRTTLRKKFSSLPWHSELPPLDSMDDQFLARIMEEIRKNMDNEYYSVEELSSAINYSRSQLFRKLKAICDKSPTDLIRECRLLRAKELLEQNAATVSEAAYQVGYSNLSYFSRSFKTAFGILPSEVTRRK